MMQSTLYIKTSAGSSQYHTKAKKQPSQFSSLGNGSLYYNTTEQSLEMARLRGVIDDLQQQTPEAFLRLQDMLRVALAENEALAQGKLEVEQEMMKMKEEARETDRLLKLMEEQSECDRRQAIKEREDYAHANAAIISQITNMK